MHKERLAKQIKHAKAMARSVVKWTLQFSTYHMQTGNSSCMGWAAAFPRGAHSSVGKESACNAGDLGSIPGSGRSAGEEIGYPLKYSGLENSMDRIVHGITKSRTGLSNFHFHWHLSVLLSIQLFRIFSYIFLFLVSNLLVNSDLAAHHSKATNQEASISGREVALIRKVGNLGRK